MLRRKESLVQGRSELGSCPSANRTLWNASRLCQGPPGCCANSREQCTEDLCLRGVHRLGVNLSGGLAAPPLVDFFSTVVSCLLDGASVKHLGCVLYPLPTVE